MHRSEDDLSLIALRQVPLSVCDRDYLSSSFALIPSLLHTHVRWWTRSQISAAANFSSHRTLLDLIQQCQSAISFNAAIHLQHSADATTTAGSRPEVLVERAAVLSLDRRTDSVLCRANDGLKAAPHAVGAFQVREFHLFTQPYLI